VIPVVPNIEDPALKKLIGIIGINTQPIYIDVKPEKNAIVNECFPNVASKIEEDGGSQINGWQIWKTENLIEAEFHAVWESDKKSLVDITPKPAPFSRILFIKDDERSYNGSQVDNIRLNISGNALVDDLITVNETIFKIENKGARAFEYELRLGSEEKQIWEILQGMKSGVSLMLARGDTKNQKCFCGRDKYKKCHGKFLPSIQSRL
jgi:hypothetical protein